MSDPNIDPNTGLPEGSAIPPDFGSTYLDDVEVIIEDPASRVSETPEEIAALKEKLAAQERQIAELAASSSTAAAVQAGIAGLARNLQQPVAPAPVAPPVQQPGESDEVFQKRLDEGLLERGATATMREFYGRVLAPEVNRLFQGNLVNSRRFVALDPEKGPMYAKYKAEVEAEVAALPPQAKLYDPEVYEKAVDRVAARHANEIIDERVNAAVAAKLAELEAARPRPPAPGPIPTVVQARGQQPAPTSTGPRKVSLTPEEAEYARKHMIPAHEYAGYLQRKGLKK